MRRYYIVRHGQTEYNMRHIVQGWCDSRLSGMGIHQADAAGKLLSAVRFDLVATGGQGRQIETANHVIMQNKQKHMVPFRPYEGLREQYYGYYDGKPEEEYHNELAPLIAEKKDIPVSQAKDLHSVIQEGIITMREMVELEGIVDYTHQAETYEKVKKRCLNAFEQIRRAVPADETNVLLVSSGGLLSVLLYELTGDERGGLCMNHGGVTYLEEEEGIIYIRRYNVNPEELL